MSKDKEDVEKDECDDWWLGWIWILIFLLGGCGRQEDTVAIDNSTGHVVSRESYGNELCYQGVVYVQFLVYSDSKTAWGGPKFTSDGKVATCQVLGKK